MAAQSGSTVAVEGLKALKRDLGRIEKAIPRELTKEMREVAKPVIVKAAGKAPRGRGRRSGRLAGSMRAYGAGRGAAVGISSRLPYSNVVHWGGTTGRGHRPGVGGSGSVKVRPHPFLADAAEEEAGLTFDRIADVIDRLCGRHGFK